MTVETATALHALESICCPETSCHEAGEWEGCAGEGGLLFDTAASSVTGHFGLVGSALGPASAAASSAATNFSGGAKGCAPLDELCLQVGLALCVSLADMYRKCIWWR